MDASKISSIGRRAYCYYYYYADANVYMSQSRINNYYWQISVQNQGIKNTLK